MSTYQAVARAIREGVLVRQPCSWCGAPKAIAHHEDYSKPLDVIWLCQKCHWLRHRERGDIKLRGRRQPIALALPPELLRTIDEFATQERRSRANLIEIILDDWVQARRGKEAA